MIHVSYILEEIVILIQNALANVVINICNTLHL